MKYDVLNLPRLRDERTYRTPTARALRHPVYGWLGLRPVLAQHTAAEHAAIRRWASSRSSLVEIGVAEGVSALAAREVMAPNGKLYLIDPFHLSRMPILNFMKRAAHRAVAGCQRGEVFWIGKFSSDAIRGWSQGIDFLLIDGDHSEAAARQDWEQWSRYVLPGGVVLFHDARLFENGWTDAGYGPVRVVDDFFRKRQILGWTIVEEIDSLVVVENIL